MSPQILIRFHSDSLTVPVELDTENAPNACDLLWRMLETPFVGQAVHAIYAGPAVLVGIPARHGEPRDGRVPVDNETERPDPGDVLLLPAAPDPEDDVWGEPGREAAVTLAIFYGARGRPFTPSGWQPGVRIGRIVSEIEQLRAACREIRFRGARTVDVLRVAPREEIDSGILHTDGASLGNPGPAGAGFVLEAPDGRVLAEGSIPLEATTVNVAEYQALVEGLAAARRLGLRRLKVRMDSQLIVRQLAGKYRVKAANLRPLFERVRALIDRFDEVECLHVSREHNERADELAGIAARQSMERSDGNRG